MLIVIDKLPTTGDAAAIFWCKREISKHREKGTGIHALAK